MLSQEYIDLLSKLIATPSISRDEKAACDILEEWILSHGLSPRRKGNNLWCGEGKILLNAHIDTVKPAASYTRDPYSATIEGDRLYGLGSNDDGGSLIALLAAYMENPEGLIFSATAEEEVSGRDGLELIFPELGEIDFALIGEPTSMNVAIAERGLMVLDCESHGRSGHAAREEGVNAIYEAMRDIEWFRSQETKMSVTMIEAGTQHNVVPDSCRFVVDIRPNGKETNEQILAYIRSNVHCDVKARSTRLNASRIDKEHPMVQRAMALGLETFESPTLSNQALISIPSFKLGPGDSARSHTADEYICLSEIEQAIEIYTKLLHS